MSAPRSLRQRQLLQRCHDALEAVQEATNSTLAELLAGEEGYRDDDDLAALETLLEEVQAELQDDLAKPRWLSFATFEEARDYGARHGKGFPAWLVEPWGERFVVRTHPGGGPLP